MVYPGNGVFTQSFALLRRVSIFRIEVKYSSTRWRSRGADFSIERWHSPKLHPNCFAVAEVLASYRCGFASGTKQCGVDIRHLFIGPNRLSIATPGSVAAMTVNAPTSTRNCQGTVPRVLPQYFGRQLIAGGLNSRHPSFPNWHSSESSASRRADSPSADWSSFERSRNLTSGP